MSFWKGFLLLSLPLFALDQATKAWIVDLVGVSKDALHVHLGLAIFLSVALLLRRWHHGPVMAWLIVAVLQSLNEIMDAGDWINWTGTTNWAETARDTGATLLWPTVLLLLWRLRLAAAHDR